jgi:DNA-binding CsgD family transcriptional regulator
MADDGARLGADGLRPELAAALESCFDAVANPELWPRATEELTAALGALGACFNMHGADADRRRLAPRSSRYGEMLSEFLADGWGEHDVRGQRGWPLLKRGSLVVLDNHISTPHEREGIPIYTELFRRHDLDTFAAIGFHANDAQWVLNLARSKAMGDFSVAEAQEMARIAPLLSRLLTFAETLASAAANGAMAALEDTATAAILVDWAGQVTEVNRPARALLGAGLAVRGARLSVERADDQAMLDGLIGVATSPEASRAGPCGGPVMLALPQGGVLMIDAVPVRAAMADAFGRSGALLILSNPGRRPRPSDSLLRELFGLTQREAQVAALIAAGDGAAEISDTLGLKASSVRQVIKVLLWKTGARRQSELVAMFARLPDGRRPA